MAVFYYNGLCSAVVLPCFLAFYLFSVSHITVSRHTHHCSVPSLSHAAAGKHQWERRKRNTQQCVSLPTTAILLHILPFMASTHSTHHPDPLSHAHTLTHLRHVMKSQDKQRLLNSTHLELSTWGHRASPTDYNKKCQSATARTPKTTTNEYIVTVFCLLHTGPRQK